MCSATCPLLQVWPTAWSDALNLVLPSVSVDVYLEPGKDVRYQEQLLTPTNADGMVCAMLGAGNHVGGGGPRVLLYQTQAHCFGRGVWLPCRHADQEHPVSGCGGADESGTTVSVHITDELRQSTRDVPPWSTVHVGLTLHSLK